MSERFYTLSVEDASSKLETDLEHGLSEQQVQERLQKYGENKLKEQTKISPWQLLLNQFKNVIVWLLLLAVGISLFMHDYVEAVAIGIVIIINALFGFFTEYRAEQAMDELKKMVSVEAKVIRDGKLTQIPAEYLVPGDLLVLEEGDSVPADARITQADNLGTVEASLTGEAEAVDKKIEALREQDLAVGDRINMVFMSTLLVRGTGRALVTETGSNTEIGKVSNLLGEVEQEKSPLEQRLDRLGKQLAVFSVILAVVMIILGLAVGRDFIELLETSIALAIAAVPEGLPAVTTITLAIGMGRMAKQNAIIRSLPAVETLGSTTVICSDKTGTLTQNEMTVEEIWLNGRVIKVSGQGYEPKGEFAADNNLVDIQNEADLQKLLAAGSLCNNAGLEQAESGEWRIIGDPTEGALIVAARKMNFAREDALGKGYKEIKEIPFSSEHKRMAVYYQLPDGTIELYAKGSPFVILDSCTYYQHASSIVPLDEAAKQQVAEANDALAGKGLRVLGLAYKIAAIKEGNNGNRNDNSNRNDNDNDHVVNSPDASNEDAFSDLVFLGLTGILDPPREEAQQAIEEAKTAGIRTVMITGDQKETAKAIGARLGIQSKLALTGTDLSKMSAEDLDRQVVDVNIFARVNPEDKLTIINALQSRGQIVAMTGDGVNDAPALKTADIGVAMGQKGTVVAKEAADMILTDNNFATIISAVRGGRVILDNIEKFIHFLFSCNISEILLIFTALLFGLPLPLVALQILWLNLVTDVFPAFALGWEKETADIMIRPPRDPQQGLLTNRFKLKTLVEGAILAAATLLAYVWELNRTSDVESARTVAFLTLAMVQVWQSYNIHNDGIIRMDKTLLNNPMLNGAVILVVFLQMLAIYTPLLNRVLGTVPLTLETLLYVLGFSLIPLAVIQAMNRLKIFKEPYPVET